MLHRQVERLGNPQQQVAATTTRLQEEHAYRGVLGEPGGEHAARGAGTDDHVVSLHRRRFSPTGDAPAQGGYVSGGSRVANAGRVTANSGRFSR